MKLFDRRVRSISYLLLLLLFTAAIWGCSSKSEEKPKIEELSGGSAITSDKGEQELFELARKHYENGLYAISRDSFQALIDTYPLTDKREYAEIKIADTYFEVGEYDAASQSYKAFIDSHPASSSLPYMLAQLGRCFRLMYRGVGRDVSNLEQGLKYFKELEAKFPGTQYGRIAGEFRRELEKALAEHEMAIVEFYHKQGNEEAYQARLTRYNEEWLPVLAQAEAEQRQAQDLPAVQEVTLQGHEPHVPETTSHSNSDVAQRDVGRQIDLSAVRARARDILLEHGASSDDESGGGNRVTEVRCHNNERREIYVYFRDEVEQAFRELETQTLQPTTDSKLTIAFPKTSARQKQLSCFSKEDLTVASDGSITLSGIDSQAEIMMLSNPPRALIELR